MENLWGLVVATILALLSLQASAGPSLADPPPGDTCDSAMVIHWGGDSEFSGDLTEFANDYDPGVPGPGCLVSGAPGKDLVLAVEVDCGLMMAVYYTPVGFDGCIYIVTDCADPSGSCVAGADALGVGGGESVTFASLTTDTYYIIVDAHDAGAGGPFSLSFNYGFWDFPPGACCFPDGRCEVMQQYLCGPAGGTFYGYCSVCDPSPCPATPVRELNWGAVKVRYR